MQKETAVPFYQRKGQVDNDHNENSPPMTRKTKGTDAEFNEIFNVLELFNIVMFT